MKSVPTKPIEGQKTGTSGLRKKTKVFMGENYLANWCAVGTSGTAGRWVKRLWVGAEDSRCWANQLHGGGVSQRALLACKCCEGDVLTSAGSCADKAACWLQWQQWQQEQQLWLSGRCPDTVQTAKALPLARNSRIQSLFNALGDEVQGKTIGLGGDGRYFNKEAVQARGWVGGVGRS